MTHSIPGDITLIDRNADGFIDRLYAADTGGKLWRVDLQPDATVETPDPSTWKATQLADVGGTGSPPRKAFFPPGVACWQSLVIANTRSAAAPPTRW